MNTQRHTDTSPRPSNVIDPDRHRAMPSSLENDISPAVVQLEISIDTLKMLFSTGKLCVADLHCLNDASKAAIWALCLSSCANRVHCDFSGLESCSACAQTSASR